MPRSVSLILSVALLAGLATSAHADDTLPGGLTIKFNRILIHENGGDLNPPSNDVEATWHYFNKAHCECARDPAHSDFTERTFAWELIPENDTGTQVNRPAEIWVGTQCDMDMFRPTTCSRITDADIGSIANLQATKIARPEINLFDLMNPAPADANKPCLEQQDSKAVWFIADGNADGTPDYFAAGTVATDTKPPPIPESFSASGAEQAIDIQWPTVGDTTDIFAYQALCANALDGTAAGGANKPAARYQTPESLCGATSDVVLLATNIDTGALGDAGTSMAAIEGISKLDPTFLCGETVTPTATSLRITGLTNGVPYQVAVVAVDKFGNVAGRYFTSLLTPTPATDFWEDLHGRGSHVEGGFCLIAETYGDDSTLTRTLREFRDDTLADSAFGRWLTTAYYATLGKLGASVTGSLPLRIVSGVLLAPLVVLALGWHYLTLPGLLAVIALLVLARRHRRKIVRSRLVHGLALASVIGTVMVVLAPATAHADEGGGFDPYWNDPAGGSTQFAEDERIVKWHVGVRVGPYVPGIDKQLGGMSPGPYKQMFGGYSILPMLDVERIVWRGFGQLGFGGNIGYMSKKAHAWLDGSDPADPMRPRSPGDETTFRLLPFALTAVYRFSYLDDEYGIPVVPYVKAGLAYYVWWAKAPNGNLSYVCSGMSSGTGCPKDTAAGASLGVQGTIGLAIRGERIDQAAANSMHESGIEHAGFFVELQLAKVDGFGSQSKLSVGDNTWFAGVDFEF